MIQLTHYIAYTEEELDKALSLLYSNNYTYLDLVYYDLTLCRSHQALLTEGQYSYDARVGANQLGEHEYILKVYK